MGHWERERGTITIPSSEWAGLKKKVRKAHNAFLEGVYEIALGVKEDLSQSTYASAKKLEKAIERACAGRKREIKKLLPRAKRRDYRRGRSFEDTRLFCEVRSMIEREIARGRYKGASDDTRAYKPRKKGFEKATSRTKSFRFGSASLVFDNDRRAAKWEVSQGRNTIEAARSHPTGYAFFRALAKVSWTRGSGGEIMGQDEIGEHEMASPGVSEAFGVEAAKLKKKLRRQRNAGRY